MSKSAERITVREAKTQLSKLIDRAMRGEDIVIHRGAKPVVRLVAVHHPAVQRRFGSMKGQVKVPDSLFDPLPEDELDAWGH